MCNPSKTFFSFRLSLSYLYLLPSSSSEVRSNSYAHHIPVHFPSFLHSFILSFLQFFHIKTFLSFPLFLSSLHFLPLSHQFFLQEPSSSGSFSGSIPTFLWGEWAKTRQSRWLGVRPKFEFGRQHKFKQLQSSVSCIQNYKTEHFVSTKHTTDT